MDSILEQLRTKTIPRLKIGIGRPNWGDASGYVLTRFTKEQNADFPFLLGAAADAVELWLAERSSRR